MTESLAQARIILAGDKTLKRKITEVIEIETLFFLFFYFFLIFFIQDIYYYNYKELLKKEDNYKVLNNRNNRHTYNYLHFTIIYITATKQPRNCRMRLILQRIN